jgi:hypothetical protein
VVGSFFQWGLPWVMDFYHSIRNLVTQVGYYISTISKSTRRWPNAVGNNLDD